MGGKGLAMNEKLLSEFLNDLEEDLKDLAVDADIACSRAKLLEERLESRECHAVKVDDCQYGCSICGYDGWMGKDAITNYCPECGAKVANGE